MMKAGEILDDRVIIPDYIKALSPEQSKKIIAEIKAFPEKTDLILDRLEKEYNQGKTA